MNDEWPIKASQSHSGAKAEGRIMNDEWPREAGKSQAKARCSWVASRLALAGPRQKLEIFLSSAGQSAMVTVKRGFPDTKDFGCRHGCCKGGIGFSGSGHLRHTQRRGERQERHVMLKLLWMNPEPTRRLMHPSPLIRSSLFAFSGLVTPARSYGGQLPISLTTPHTLG